MELVNAGSWDGDDNAMKLLSGTTLQPPILSTLFLLIATSLPGAGCISNRHPAASVVQSPPFHFAPRQMAADVKQIVSSPPISMSFEDEQAGQIVTDWQPYRGDFHVIRYWFERTRYHITVVPDFNDPAHRSRIQVVDETQQRPTDSGPNQEAKKWSAAPDLHRPERAAALLQQIETQLATYRE